MSRYTTQLRNIITMQVINSKKTPASPMADIKIARPFIFNFDYPIWSQADKESFESGFLLHYYFSEIGCETVAQWKTFLQSWLLTNMDYYSARMNAILYLKEFQQLFDNVNYTEIGQGSETENNNGENNTVTESSGDNKTVDKYYEVPSRSITDITDHLNNLRNNTLDATSNTSNAYDYTDRRNKNHNNTLTRKGFIGVNRIEQVEKYLGQLENLKKEIYDGMSSLFMEIY